MNENIKELYDHTLNYFKDNYNLDIEKYLIITSDNDYVNIYDTTNYYSEFLFDNNTIILFSKGSIIPTISLNLVRGYYSFKPKLSFTNTKDNLTIDEVIETITKILTLDKIINEL